MSVSIGPKIGIEGEAEFRRQIQQINQEFQTLASQTKAVTEAFRINDDEQGRLRATAQQLEKQIESQKKKLALLREGVDKASGKFQDAQKRSEELGSELSSAKDELERMKAAMDKTGDASGDLKKQIDAQKEKVTDLEKQLAKANAETQNADIASNKWKQTLHEEQAKLFGLEKELKQTSKSTEDFAAEVEDAGDSLEDAGKSALDFGDILKANFLSDAIMAGVRKLGEMVKDFASGIIESAASVSAENAQFQQTFADLEAQARQSLESISSDAGIAATRMQGSYTKIYAFAKTAGASSEEAMEIAGRAMHAAADSAAYYDRSIEDATETLQSFLKGNYANDAALGIAATETTRNTKANERYAKSFQQLSESQKVDVLLSMVEAGNKASGALGQAARESDAWENVTGELDEAQRQLQATMGKPVMKNLIPLLQKITKKTNELAQSGDLDRFAEDLGDSLGWIIDNGPEIVRVIGSITTGYLAFKLAIKAKHLGDLATGFIQMGKAAQTASVGIAASGAALNATPWGLAATLIGAVVTGITALATSSNSAKDDVDELTQKTDAMVEGFAKAESTYWETTTSVESAAAQAEIYASRLKDLEAQGVNTAAAQHEYKMAVDALNQLIPDLNLEIDEQTGLLRGGAKALDEQIKSWKEAAIAEAMYTKYKDKIAQIADATAEAYTNQAKINKLDEEQRLIKSQLMKLDKERLDLEQKIREATSDPTSSQDELLEYARLLEQVNYKTKELTDTQASNGKEIGQLEGAIGKYNIEIDKHRAEIDETKSSYELLLNDLENGTGTITTSASVVMAKMGELRGAYDNVYNSAYESITQQIGLFDDLSGKCDMTFDDMLRNLDSQISAFSNYANNIQLAAERGIDQGLIQQLSDGSAESMQILDVLVNGTDEQIRELSEKLQITDSERKRFARSVAGLNTDFQNEMKKIIQDARESAENIVRGLVDGISASSPEYYEAMKELAWKGQQTFKNQEMIASPSKVYRKFAGYDVAGLVEGFRQGEKDVREAVARLAKAGQSQLNSSEIAMFSGMDFTLPIPPGAAQYGGSGGGTKNINLGGISIRIDAPRITDPEQLADIVATRINDQVTRRLSTYA